MNVSKLHREDLLNKIQQIRTYIASAQQDTNTGNLLQYLDEITKDVKGKKYGLVFEQHREKIDETLETHTPVLTEQKDLFIDNGGEMNFLIEGDNLAALKLLEKTHKGKIDVIYIDPPYNTGMKSSDGGFKYNDDFVEQEDSFKHSKWLSFMEKRLNIAKELLSKKGVIFISIDDNEQAALKIICDDIFGHENNVAVLQVETSAIAGPRRFAAINGSIVKTSEYVLVYSKQKNAKVVKRPTYDYIGGFDTHYSLYWNQVTEKFVNFVDFLKNTPQIASVFGKYNLKISLKNLSKVLILEDPISEWLYSKKVSENLFREGDRKEFPNGELNEFELGTPFLHAGCFYRKTSESTANDLFRYADRIGECDDYYSSYGERTIRGNLWKGFSSDGGNLAKEGGVSFKNGKKPRRLIKQLLKTISENNSSSIVLDFFAGSGTTAESVMKLNAEDGGKRKFILCTNNENNICRDVTYERLKTVITGKRKDGSEYSEKYDASLKYYKIDFVKIDDKMYYEYADDLLKHVRELVELENGINFNGNAEIAIVLTDDEMEKFVADGRRDVACRVSTLYRGHDVLMTAEQEAFLQENGIKVNVIPDYYYNELNR